MSLYIRLCTLRIRIHFLKDLSFRVLMSLRNPFDNLCYIEGYLYDPIDCVKPTITTEPRRVYRKNNSFNVKHQVIKHKLHLKTMKN